MSSYRISGLFALPPAFDRMKFRKALNAMSVHAVSRRWLTAEAGLAGHEVDSLLSLLDGAGVLVGPLSDAPEEALASRREGTWRLLVRLARSRLAPPAGGAPGPAVPPAPGHAAQGWLDDLPPGTLERIAEELHVLLAHHPGARRALVHLSVLESTLHDEETAAAQALPLEVLRGALEQLEVTGVPAGCTGLAILRMRLMLAVLRHGDESAPLLRAIVARA